MSEVKRLISLQGLQYTYDPLTPTAYTALRGLDFCLDDGEILGVIGHTGTGKSTLLRLLVGLLDPSAGLRCYDDSISADRRRPLPGRIGMVFQYPEDQLFEETVAEDVSFGPRQLGASREEAARRAAEALVFMGMDPAIFNGRSPFELSGGQRRKVAIAGVLALDPKILIFDEPSSGLDPLSKWRFVECVRELNARGRSIVIVSHDMEILAALAGRIAVLHEGAVAFDGSPREVFSRVEELRRFRIGSFVINEFLHDAVAAGIPLGRQALSLEEFCAELQEFVRPLSKFRSESHSILGGEE